MLLFHLGSTAVATRLYKADHSVLDTFLRFLKAVNACRRDFWPLTTESSSPRTMYVRLLGSIQGTFWSLPPRVVDHTIKELEVRCGRCVRACCVTSSCTASQESTLSHRSSSSLACHSSSSSSSSSSLACHSSSSPVRPMFSHPHCCLSPTCTP
jgi:hypothetical protein